MKFLSSSSTSSTTSAAAAGGNAEAPGCIAGMFRRLLCSTALPTHPSDSDHAIQKLRITKPEEQGKKIEPNLANAGVIARLMGLESMPMKSISRSQSMNSIDSLRELNSGKENHFRFCSFREVPTYLEDENFFILSFEYGGKQGKTEQKKQRKAEKAEKNCKRRESVYQKNKENENPGKMIPRKDSDFSAINGKFKDSTNILRSTKQSEVSKKKKEKERKDCCLDGKKTEAECDSENSSPNSVLDSVEFPGGKQIPISEKFSRLASLKSRRTLSEELENYRKLKPISDDFNKPKRSEKVVGSEPRKNWGKDENYVKIWGEICKLAKVETVQNNWQQQHKETWKHEFCQEIGGNFEIEILDELVGELVFELRCKRTEPS